MYLIALAVLVLAMLALGLVLFHALARMVSSDPLSVPSGADLLLVGLLPGLALLVMLITLLSLLHLVRDWVMVPLAVVLLVVLRKDTVAVTHAVADSAKSIVKAARAGDIFPFGALLVGLIVTYVGLFLCLVPANFVDIWYYHLPLARSIAEHGGFIYPQVPNLLYASQPIALEMLHGAGMSFLDHFAVAGAIDLAIYLGLLLFLLSFARRARGLQFLILCNLFVWHLAFYSAASPMIDMPESCLSVSAFLFAYRYACAFRRLDLVLSGLMAGFAVSAKITGLITPLIICLTLAPLIYRRGSWRDLIPAAATFTAISAYWYVKNLVLYGNPIYPFLFAHPGLSDAYMRDYMIEIMRPYDVADRVFNTDLSTLKGWHDFCVVMQSKFIRFGGVALVASSALLLPLPRRWMLPFWSVLLFVIWYAVMFNSVRWAGTAVMLTVSTAFLVGAFVLDHLLDAWDGNGPQFLSRLAKPLRQHDFSRGAPLVASLALMLVFAFAGGSIVRGHGHNFLPSWMDDSLLTAMTRTGDPEKYLDATRPDYEIYRYIGRHQLAQVFQPYDNGAIYYASAYNDGRPNRWILDYRTMPAPGEEAQAFLARNHVHYFIQPFSLTPVEVERLGPDHIALANRIVAELKPNSRLVTADRFGNRLYEIVPQVPR